jgi:hypothetical protein
MRCSCQTFPSTGDNPLMRLESVRELKRVLLGEDGEALGLPGAADGAIALGVAPAAGPGDYRLAVRVQGAEPSAERLALIDRAARGEVDVRRIGRVIAQSEPGSGRQRPVEVGASVGHFAITAGSVGAFVRVEDDERARLLSNNHVLANENQGRRGDEILQPGPADGGRMGADRIATLERFVELDTAGVNEVDAALALLDDGIEFVNEIGGDPLASEPAAPEEVEAVIKQGRTTGLTRGSVSAIEVDGVSVSFSAGTLVFDDQVEISGRDGAFSAGGDSGSLITDEATRRGIALLFAGSEQGGPGGTGVTYGNPLTAVFARLQITGVW